MCLKEVSGRGDIEVDDIMASIDSYFLKMKMIYFYRCTKKFTGNALLIRADEQQNFISSAGEQKYDYGLSEVIINFNS